MSRHFRSAYSIAQVAVAGPSRGAIAQPTLRPAMHLSRRTLFDNYLPGWLSRRKEEDRERAREKREAEARGTGGSAPGEIEVQQAGQTGIFGEIGQSGDATSGTTTTKKGNVGVDAIHKANAARRSKKYSEHVYTSAKHKISPKKLEMLAHQIQGLPVDEAILQMQFSLKGAARWIKPNLVMARDHAIDFKNMKRERLMVSEAIVNKEKYGPKQMDIKGRGRFGIKRHRYCRLKLVLREGRTMEEKVAIRFAKDVNKHARSAGFVREDQKIRRKSPSSWAW